MNTGTGFIKDKVVWEDGYWIYVLEGLNVRHVVWKCQYYLVAFMRAWWYSRKFKVKVYVYRKDGTINGIFHPKRRT